jgi:dCTP deaminase
MLISGSKLRELLGASAEAIYKGDFRKIKSSLVITPILEFDDQVKKSSSAFDLRLGMKFMVHKKSKVPSYDPLNKTYEYYKEHLIDYYHVDLGDEFVLHPGQFILGLTLEWIYLPKKLGCYVIGRSSWGRQGLIIATATGVHPGFKGNLVLELFNAGEIPIHLHPGVKIAQLFIHEVRLGSKIKQESDASQSVGQTKPTAYPPINEIEKKILKHLYEERHSNKTRSPKKPE